MNLPRPLQELSDQFEALPGIGKKTAARLAFYLLNVPQERLERFSQALLDLKQKVRRCKNCFNLTENEICDICSDNSRDKSILCIVEEVADLIVLEQTKKYNGLYHVLYGRIDPLNNLGPEDILIPQLLARIKQTGKELKEIIISTNPNMEGETTAMYIRNKINELKDLPSESEGSKINEFRFKITRLAYGLPMGASIEYADYTTLGRSLENRNQF